jgi:chromosome segregation ATPase
LRAELAELQQQLDAQVQSHNVELDNLAKRTKELETSRRAVEERVNTLTQALAAETKRCENAKQQAANFDGQRNELASELAASRQTRTQLRAELAELQQQLDARVQSHNVELDNLTKRTKELETSRRAVEEKVNTLTQALAAETKRCENAKQQAANFDGQRNELASELAGLQEQLNTASAELKNFRQRADVEALRRAQMAEQIVESEKVRAELGEKLNAARALSSTLEAAIHKLEIELQQSQDAHERLGISLQAEVTHGRRLETQIESVQSQLADATNQLAQKGAAETVWLGRQSELQSCVRSQQGDLAKSGASLAIQDVELKNARGKMEELQMLQSALCAKVRALTKQDESAAEVIQELKAKLAHSEAAVSNGHKGLAGLRYAILDTSRMNANLHRDRSLQERQNLHVLQQQLSSLAQTPLSLAQRGMLAKLRNSMDNLKNNRTCMEPTASYPVEVPGFRSSEFCFADVVESAFQAVRVAAEAAGVEVQVSAAGMTNDTVIGCAEQVHQLITLLASSPLTIMTGVTALDLRMATKPRSGRIAEMTLRAALSTDGQAQDLLLRLTSVTAAALTLQTGSFNEAELGLAAGWQLALALGADATVKIEGGNEVCLMISLPMETPGNPTLSEEPDSHSSANHALVCVSASNGNGNGSAHQNQNGNDNGRPSNESLAAVGW